jgi:predicted nucleic acid-binding protein
VPWYLDTSAAVKLVMNEPGSAALASWLATGVTVVSSDLLRTELLRAVRRVDPALMVRARAVLDSVALISVSSDLFDRAALLDPISLRSLDALHLVAALDLGDSLDGIVAYDQGLIDAATALGIAAISPT